MPVTNAHKYLTDPQAPPATRMHVNWLTSSMYAMQDKINHLQNHHLTKAEAKQLYSPAVLRQHLLAGGKHALTIHNMLGVAAEPQLANIPITVGTLGSVPTTFATSDAGHLFIAQDVGHQFIWTGSAWSMLDGAGYGTFSTVQPQPHAFWVLVPPAGGSVNVTKPDASGITSVSFPAYTAPGTGYQLYVRI
jgi:hypothetical protein